MEVGGRTEQILARNENFLAPNLPATIPKIPLGLCQTVPS